MYTRHASKFSICNIKELHQTIRQAINNTVTLAVRQDSAAEKLLGKKRNKENLREFIFHSASSRFTSLCSF